MLRCSKCPWTINVPVYSTLLFVWLLQVHHYQAHGGKKPLVVTDGVL